MKKEHNLVKCKSCEWQLENYPERNWETAPCHKCKNTRLVIDPKEVLCNLCGECMCPIGTMNEQYPHGLYEANVVGGYDSYHLFDLAKYEFSFCEKCLRQLFIQCKIKPNIYDVDLNENVRNESPWERDQEYYEYRLWVDDGSHHQAYVNKKCNRKKDCNNDAVYTLLINDDFSEECCCEEHKIEDGGSYKKIKFISNVLKPFL